MPIRPMADVTPKGSSYKCVQAANANPSVKNRQTEAAEEGKQKNSPPPGRRGVVGMTAEEGKQKDSPPPGRRGVLLPLRKCKMHKFIPRKV